MKVQIKRMYGELETLGDLQVLVENFIKFECKTIELPDKDNQHNISCIPEGDYTVTKIVSPSKGKCFLLHDVPNRSAVEIHIGNYAAGKKVDTEGCILPGLYFADRNNDGIIDVADSTKAMIKLLEILPDKFELSIIH
jgi:hypothetical protein